MAASGQAAQLCIAVVFHQFQQLRIPAKKLFPNAGAVVQGEMLHLPIQPFVHSLDQQSAVVLFEQAVPVVTPDDLDHVPAGPAEGGFEFLDDFPIAAGPAGT